MSFKKSSNLSLVLTCVAAVCFYFGLTLPLMTFETFFFFERDASLVKIINELWVSDSWPLALLIGAFSVGLPVLKLLYLLAAGVWPKLVSRKGALSFLGQLSKWSMLDVLVVAVVIVATKTTGFAKAVTQPGLWLFASAVLLMAVATYLTGRRAR